MEHKKFWNYISRNYDSHSNRKYAKTYANTIEKTKVYLKNSDIVLDFACGTGLTTIPLSNYVNRIHAIDISNEMIKIAKNKSLDTNHSNIDFEVSEIFDEKIKKDHYDVVMAFNVILFIKDTDSLIKRINQLLKSNGVFISTTDCYKETRNLLFLIQKFLSIMGVLPYIKYFKTEELEEVIRNGNFTILETQSLYDFPPNYFIAAKRTKKIY